MENSSNHRCLCATSDGARAAYLLLEKRDLNEDVVVGGLAFDATATTTTVGELDHPASSLMRHQSSDAAAEHNTANSTLVRKRKKNSEFAQKANFGGAADNAKLSGGEIEKSALTHHHHHASCDDCVTLNPSEKNSPVMQKVIKQDSSLLESPLKESVVLVESFLLVPDSAIMGNGHSSADVNPKFKSDVHLTSSCSFCGQTASRIEMLEHQYERKPAEAPEATLNGRKHEPSGGGLPNSQSFIRSISNKIRNRRRTTSLSELTKNSANGHRKLNAMASLNNAKMEAHAENPRSENNEISGGVSAAVASAVSVTVAEVDQAVPSSSVVQTSHKSARSPPKNKVVNMMISKFKSASPPRGDSQTRPLSLNKDFENFSNLTFFKQCNIVTEWFRDLNEDCKNSLLGMLLDNCGQSQNHLLSLKIVEPHFNCEPNCCDMISLLPKVVSRQIFSYLDPVSLARASQVNTYWYELANDSILWRKFCHLPKWRFSPSSEAKQMQKFIDTDEEIDWKGVFAERFRVKRNWFAGKSTVKTFQGHEGAVSCVQFDDKRIVAGSSIGTIKVWHIAQHSDTRPYLNLYGHSGIIRCLYLDGTLNRLYSGSADHSIKVWDLSDHPTWSRVTCKMTLLGHTETVRCLQVNGPILISGSYDSTLKIWSLETGTCQNTLRGHTDAVLCLQFDHEKIVSGSADKTIRIWNFEGSCLQQLEGHSGAITCLHFDSQRIISGSLDFDIKFWRIDNGLCINTLNWITKEGHTAAIRCLKADSQKIVSCSDDKTIKIWNIETGERYVTLKNHTDGVTCLQFNDYYILSGSYDRTIKLWDFSAL